MMSGSLLRAAYVRGSTGQSSNSTLVVTVSPRLKISLVREIRARAHCARLIVLRAFSAPRHSSLTSSASFTLQFARAGVNRSLDPWRRKRGAKISRTQTLLYLHKTLHYTNPLGVSTSLSTSLLLTPSPCSPARPGSRGSSTCADPQDPHPFGSPTQVQTWDG